MPRPAASPPPQWPRLPIENSSSWFSRFPPRRKLFRSTKVHLYDGHGLPFFAGVEVRLTCRKVTGRRTTKRVVRTPTASQSLEPGAHRASRRNQGTLECSKDGEQTNGQTSSRRHFRCHLSYCKCPGRGCPGAWRLSRKSCRSVRGLSQPSRSD